MISKGYQVIGAALPAESDVNISHLRHKIKLDRYDIVNPDDCKRHLKKAEPNLIFHLAALASVGKSFSMADITFKVNVLGTQNIFNAARDMKRLKKIIFVSSSDVYGPVKPEDMPLKPDRPFNPVSPYAQSKAAAEYLAQIFYHQHKLPIIIVRAFNHSGPKQTSDFVIPAFCQKIIRAEKSKGKRTIKVGNLSARRDFCDVRDIVRGYRMLAEKGKAGEVYQLCSGRDIKIGDILKILASFSSTPIIIEKSNKLLRKIDIPVLRGSYHKTKKEIGWKPEIPIEKTLTDTMNFWRDTKNN